MLMRFLAATIALAMVCIPAPRAEELRFFRIATAATGGTYYPVGALIATAISAPPGSRPCAQGGPCGVAGLIASAARQPARWPAEWGLPAAPAASQGSISSSTAGSSGVDAMWSR